MNWSNFHSRFLTLILIFVFSIPLLFAAEQDQVESQKKRLEQIDQQISQLQEQLKTLSSQKQNTIIEIESFKTRERLARAEYDRLSVEISQLETNISSLELSIEDQKKEIDAVSERVKLVLRKLYKRGSLDYLKMLLSMKSMEKVSIAQAYLSRLAKEEVLLITRFNSRIHKYQQDIETLRREKSEIETKREQSLKALDDSKKNRESLQKLLSDISRKTGIYQQSLQDKHKAREELQALIKRLAERKSSVTTDVSFSTLKGKLEWPVVGRIVSRFGTLRDQVWDVSYENDGIEISATTGTPILSVAPGKIIFGDWNDMGGNMVVIDHGNRYYTIYAHLSRIMVETGQEIPSGMIIGESGDTASLKGPLLRFEIRHITGDSNPQALNPLEWLRKR